MIEKSQEIIGQITLIILGKRAHNTEVDGDIFGVFRISRIHHDIAWMHISMEKAVFEDLCKKDLNTHFS